LPFDFCLDAPDLQLDLPRLVLEHDDSLLETGDLTLLEVKLLQKSGLLALEPQPVALGPNSDLLQPCSWAWTDGIVRQTHPD